MTAFDPSDQRMLKKGNLYSIFRKTPRRRATKSWLWSRDQPAKNRSKKENAHYQSRTNDLRITSATPYQLGQAGKFQ